MRVLPSRRTDVVVTDLGDQLVVLDPRTNAAHAIAGPAAALWPWCDGTTTVARASSVLKLDESLVRAACAELAAAGLVDEPGLTRRRALQGGALVGTAMVSTILIPRAAAAASGPGGPGGGGGGLVTLTLTGFSAVTIPAGATAVKLTLTGGAGGNADVSPPGSNYPTWFGGGGGTVVWDLGAGYALPSSLLVSYDVGTAGARITGGVSGPAGLHGGSGYDYNGYAAGGGGAASKVTFSGAASGVIIAGGGGGSGNGVIGGPGGSVGTNGSGGDGSIGTFGNGTAGPLVSVSPGGAFGGPGEAGQAGINAGFGEGGGTGAGGHAGQTPAASAAIIGGYGGGAGSNAIDAGLTLNGVSPTNGATSTGDGQLTVSYLP